MICVIVRIKVSAGRRDDFLIEFRKIVPKVLAEEGCVEYGPWIDVPTNIEIQPPERTHTIVCVEKWESLDALEAHLVTPHMIEFRKATEGLRAGIELEIIGPAE